MMETQIGPLSGLRVLELESLAPAPFGCLVLCQLGAEVVTVRRPRRSDGPDLLGRSGPVSDPLQDGRRTIELDLADPADHATVLDLARDADVFVEGFRPGVVERLGLAPADLQAENPGLIYARMTGWGQTGPRSRSAGHDINYLALTGALDAIGSVDGPPIPPLNLVADFGGGGMFLVVGILAALQARARDGRGDVIDVAMVDGVAALSSFVHGMEVSGGWSARRGTNVLDGGAPFYTTYSTADGRWLAVGAVEDAFYDELLDLLQIDPSTLPDRWERESWDELRDALARRFAAHDRDHWDQVFQDSDACVTPVLTFAEARTDHHLASRGTFEADSPYPQGAPRFSRHRAMTVDPSQRIEGGRPSWTTSSA